MKAHFQNNKARRGILRTSAAARPRRFVHFGLVCRSRCDHGLWPVHDRRGRGLGWVRLRAGHFIYRHRRGRRQLWRCARLRCLRMVLCAFGLVGGAARAAIAAWLAEVVLGTWQQPATAVRQQAADGTLRQQRAVHKRTPAVRTNTIGAATSPDLERPVRTGSLQKPHVSTAVTAAARAARLSGQGGWGPASQWPAVPSNLSSAELGVRTCCAAASTGSDIMGALDSNNRRNRRSHAQP